MIVWLTEEFLFVGLHDDAFDELLEHHLFLYIIAILQPLSQLTCFL